MVELVKFDVPAISLISSSTWVDAVIGVWHTLLYSFWFGASQKLLAVLADSSNIWYKIIKSLVADPYPSAIKHYTTMKSKDSKGCDVCSATHRSCPRVRLRSWWWSSGLRSLESILAPWLWCQMLTSASTSLKAGIYRDRHWGWRSFPFMDIYIYIYIIIYIYVYYILYIIYYILYIIYNIIYIYIYVYYIYIIYTYIYTYIYILYTYLTHFDWTSSSSRGSTTIAKLPFDRTAGSLMFFKTPQLLELKTKGGRRQGVELCGLLLVCLIRANISICWIAYVGMLLPCSSVFIRIYPYSIVWFSEIIHKTWHEISNSHPQALELLQTPTAHWPSPPKLGHWDSRDRPWSTDTCNDSSNERLAQESHYPGLPGWRCFKFVFGEGSWGCALHSKLGEGHVGNNGNNGNSPELKCRHDFIHGPNEAAAASLQTRDNSGRNLCTGCWSGSQ